MIRLPQHDIVVLYNKGDATMALDLIDIPARFFKAQKRAVERWAKRGKISQAQVIRDLVDAEMEREKERG
jgi:hypothetical protein